MLVCRARAGSGIHHPAAVVGPADGSGNDAANMLADMLGGQQVAVAAMNRKAASLGATSTRASSPSGLDGPGWELVTTLHDLAVIYRAALTYPLIAQIFRPGRHLSPARRSPPEQAAGQLSGHDRRQDGLYEPRPRHLRRRSAAGQPAADRGGDVRRRRPVRRGHRIVRLGLRATVTATCPLPRQAAGMRHGPGDPRRARCPAW